MVYIIATLLRKAIETGRTSWQDLMLVPEDYDDASLHHPLTRQIMAMIDFRHGGREYDEERRARRRGRLLTLLCQIG